MILSVADSGGHAIFSRTLRGQPNVLQTTMQSSVNTKSVARKIKNPMPQPEAVNEVDKKSVKVPDKIVTRPFTFSPTMKKKEIDHTAEECSRVEPNDKPDVSKLDHYTVRKDILEEVRKGRFIIEVAPSDLVDFGGQRSYDMTHQVFIQHRGFFIIMFNGRYKLNTPLMEYPQGDVTSECKYSLKTLKSSEENTISFTCLIIIYYIDVQVLSRDFCSFLYE